MTRKTDAAARPAPRKTSNRRARAAAPAVAPSTLRRDLGQQTSRFALLTAIGLAAAGAGSLASPGEAFAQCATNGVAVTCATTSTTNTTAPQNPPSDRAHTFNSGANASLTIVSGAQITEYGVAIENTGAGGASVRNDGSVFVQQGRTPLAGGAGAVTLRGEGPLTYSGDGSIVNEGAGEGLLVLQDGGGAVDIETAGTIRATNAAAVNVQSGGDSVSIATRDLSGARGLEVFGVGGAYTGDLNISAGNVTGANGAGVDASSGASATAAFTGDVSGATDGIRLRAGAGDGGDEGDANLTVTGNVTGGTGSGVDVTNESSGGINASIGGAVNAGGVGVSASAEGPINLTVGSVTGGTGGIRTRSREATDGAGFGIAAVGDVNVIVEGDIVVANGRGYEHVNDGTGSTNYTQAGGITSNNGDGIHIRHGEDSGAIDIDISGPVTSTGNDAGGGPADGIDAQSGSLDGGISIVAGGDVSGAGNGITAGLDNLGGSGDINIRAEGDVSGQTGSGIMAISRGVESDIVIVANGDVTGSDNALGIVAELGNENGDGGIGIATTGTVTGGVGIAVRNAGSGEVLVIANGDVTGAVGLGIGASGEGMVAVMLGGHVTGATDGVRVAGGNGGGDVTVTGTNGANSRITAEGGTALTVLNGGGGRTAVNIAGAITATGGAGVDVEDTPLGGAIEVTVGDVSSTGSYGINIESRSERRTGVSVLAEGDVSGTLGGINLSASPQSGNISVRTRGTVEGGVGITVSGGDASGGISIVAEDTVTGTTGAGIRVNHNDGTLAITATSVTGATDGISINTTGAGGQVIVNGSGNLTAQNGSGIDRFNPGSDPFSFTWGGVIDATNGDGVRVRDTVNGGDITIDVGAVTARGTAANTSTADGIDIESESLTADIDVTTAGHVQADGYGILVNHLNEDATGDITIRAASVTAGENSQAISAFNAGSGAVNITTSGAVRATDDAAIFAEGRGDINIVANGDTSGTTAVDVLTGQGSSGNVSVRGEGNFSSTDGDGISVANSGTGTVTVAITGDVNATGGSGVFVLASNSNAVGGDVNITTGNVTATDLGIYGETDSRDVTIRAQGDVVAGSTAVGARIYDTAGDADIDIRTDGAVRGGGVGIFADNSSLGDVNITANEVVDGDEAAGIFANGRRNVTVEANATVTGATRGATIIGGEAGVVGPIEQDIVVRGTGGFVGEAGDALNITNNGRGDVRVNISGASSATGGSGIRITDTADAGDIDITTGAVTATGNAIAAVSQSNTGNVSVTANGDLTAGDTGVIAGLQSNLATGDVTVRTNGAVRGDFGISAGNAGIGDVDVTTNGDVSGARFEGLRAEGRRNVSVEVNGNVAGGRNGAVIIGGEAGVPQAEQDITVRGTGGFTSGAGNALDITNRGGGDVRVDISGATSATGGSGVYIADTVDGGNIDVTTGAITATGSTTSAGIDIVSASETGDVTVRTNGDVSASGAGIIAGLGSADSEGDISVTTNGSVRGIRGILAANSGSGDIDLVAEGRVTATGSAAESHGITATGRRAVSVTANDTVTGISGAVILGGEAGQADDVEQDITVRGTGGFVSRDGDALLVSNRGHGDVLVAISGATSATGGVGVRILDTAEGGDINVTTGSVSSSSSDGIQVEALTETGDIAITSNGDINAGFVGIFAGLSEDAVGSIDITTNGSVTSAQTTGIVAQNQGRGAISVTANGDVTAARGIGITAFGRDDVTVRADGRVAGQFFGAFIQTGETGVDSDVSVRGEGSFVATQGSALVIQNNGTGDTEVDISGASSATGGSGIVIVDTRDGGNVDVTVGAVRATATAAAPTAYGYDGRLSTLTGNNRLRTTGDVYGSTGGIVMGLTGDTATGEVSLITDGDVAGGFGIQAFNAGTGALSVTTNGDVTGETGSGLQAIGRGAVSVAVNGQVTGASQGLIVQGGEAARGDNIVVTGTGAITSGEGNAVFLSNRGNGIVNYDLSGALSATDGDGLFLRDTEIGGDITVRTGDVTALDGIGLNIVSLSDTADINLTVEGDVAAGEFGVLAMLAHNQGTGVPNLATGAIRVVTNGDVTAESGILAIGGGQGGAVDVEVNGDVTGTDGAGVSIGGTGDASLRVEGSVTGSVTGAIVATTGDISVSGAGDFSGGTGAGLALDGQGDGDIVADLTGAITSESGDAALVASMGEADGGDISLNVGDVTANGAASRGIDVYSASNTGDITVSAGAVNAGSVGIRVLREIDATGATGNIAIAVDGPIQADTGIFARNIGAGSTTVVATGAISATDGSGIVATAQGGAVSVQAGTVNAAGTDSAGVSAQRTGAGAGDVTVDVDSARGARGVVANNSGAGDVVVTADTATGTAEEAIVAQKLGAGSAGDVDVTVASATGRRGVLASNQGAGATRVTSTGTITASGTEGVLAFAAGAGGVSVDVNNVTGGTIGVATSNIGSGATDIAINGLVTGSEAGVLAASSGDQAVRINNDGTIRNSSNRSFDIALQAGGGQIDLTNAGTIFGRLILQGDASNTINRGSWNGIGGQSDFQGSDDRLVNTGSGVITGGSDAATAESSLWQGLESFRNAGVLDLSDGGIGDLIATSANTVFAGGSTLQVDIGGTNLADVFRTTGALTIEAGARLEVGSVQSLSIGQRYIVAAAANGLTGEFDFEERLVSAFLGLRDGYTATQAYLELWQMRSFEEAGDTWNRRETGRGVDSLPMDNPLREAVLVLPDDGAARAAFDQLSGEIHPAIRRAMSEGTRQSREAVLDRLEEPGEGRFWGHASYQRGRVPGDGNAASTDLTSNSMLFGADGNIAPNVTVGVAAGWLDTDVELDSRNSNGTALNVHAMGYAGVRMDRWSLRGGVGYAWTSIDTERTVAFPGVTDRLRAEYDGSVLQAFIEAGYRMPTNGGYLEPFVNVTTVHANTDAFSETGGVARIVGEGVRDDLTLSTAGFRIRTIPSGPLSARGMVGVRHMNGDMAPTGRHHFPGGDTISILSSLHSDMSMVATFEADWRLTPWLSLGAAFEGAHGDEGGDHAVRGQLKVAF
ncbi:hypothetical protein GCM10009422_25970 [Brevundimonas kwangchunensis]|uniref:Autotransporter domain-containing protein n=1 Tax=Brevundimonas kwangchunensis TaxID=322163 RepID=A0ABN1H354_9CAUL